MNIKDNEIIVEITNDPDDLMTISDGSTKEFIISVFLEDSDIIEGDVIQLAIPNNSLDWEVPSGSSEFAQNFTSFEGNTFDIEVIGEKLEFIIQPSTTNINEAMSNVEVGYTDANGNIDIDFSTDISITSTGTLNLEPVVTTPISGVSVFNNLIHSAVGTNLTLTASAVDETDITSNTFDIIDSPELFIAEVADPDNEPNARYVEIFNAGVTAIDFSTDYYYIVRQANGGTTINATKLIGSIPAKAYYTIGINNNVFNNQYGFFPNMISSFINGNGNDAYFLSVDDANNDALKNSAIDIYGVIDQNGTGEPWEYEDSRGFRNNPTVKNANTTWTDSEWTIESNADVADMTPGYGDNDYIYVNDTDGWNDIGLGNPNSTPPTGAQNIFIRSGEVTLTNDTSIGDLVVRSGATLRIQGLLEVAGDIVNEGTIIFESTAAQTAVLGEVAPNTRVVGDGFEMHRYFTAKRSFRYVSSSVNSTENINANWQEGLVNTDLNTNNPGTSGFGTHITGPLDPLDLNDNLGFDATATRNPSMFTWDNATQNWIPIPNTNATDLILGQAYALMVRGDRTTDLTMNNAPASPTTLRSTGSIHVGDFPVTNLPENSTEAIPKYALVGNPYPAQVNMQTLLLTQAFGFNPNHMWVYDPNIGPLGGYATVDLSDGFNVITTPDSSEANEFLQPNQAVFLQTTATSPILTFVESAKASGAATLQTFGEETPVNDYSLSINLMSSDQGILVDGVKLKMASTYADEVNLFDAVKFWNTTEQLAIKNGSNYLSIEKRSFPSTCDTLSLYLGNYQAQDYQFEFKNELPSHIEAVFYDQYLDQMHPISSGLSQYAYPIDVVLPESMDSDRFFIIFSPENLDVDTYTEFSEIIVYPNPVSNGIVNLKLPSEIKIGTSIEISIFDALGNRIMQKELNTTEQTLSFQLGNLSAGVYLLKAIQGNEQYTQKLIVE